MKLEVTQAHIDEATRRYENHYGELRYEMTRNCPVALAAMDADLQYRKGSGCISVGIYLINVRYAGDVVERFRASDELAAQIQNWTVRPARDEFVPGIYEIEEVPE